MFIIGFTCNNKNYVLSSNKHNNFFLQDKTMYSCRQVYDIKQVYLYLNKRIFVNIRYY